MSKISKKDVEIINKLHNSGITPQEVVDFINPNSVEICSYLIKQNKDFSDLYVEACKLVETELDPNCYDIWEQLDCMLNSNNNKK